MAFFGTGAALLYRQRRAYVKKRRARRAGNGARSEVVVVAGPVESPLVKGVVMDLERRGFVVYVVVGSAREEQKVQDNGRVDVRPLYMDITEVSGTAALSFTQVLWRSPANSLQPASTQDAMHRFGQILVNPHHAVAGATPHKLNFAGLVIAPDLDYPAGPTGAIEPAEWAEMINVKVLGTIYTAQAFLQVINDFKARVIMLTPSITSSLKSPLHGVEVTAVGALEGFIYSLAGELRTVGIDVCHLKLGNVDLSTVGGRSQSQRVPGDALRAWPASAQSTYERNFDGSSFGATKGSPSRELHNAVFDALVQRRPKLVWRIGRGSMAYELVGNWIPAAMVQWMLGARKVGINDRGDELNVFEDSAHSSQWDKVENTA